MKAEVTDSGVRFDPSTFDDRRLNELRDRKIAELAVSQANF